jgi:LmbE family N-acetylglucosaminyl deacetylase
VRDLEPSDLAAKQVLAVGAHPDDAEFYAGGTLALLSHSGAQVTLVVCTDGRRGGRGVDDVIHVRHAEQDRAAKALGIHEVLHLGRPDGELVPDDSLRAELVRAIRRTRPELILTHDPTTLWTTYGSRVYLGHTDHRATGQALLDAVYPRAANPNFFPDQLEREGLKVWYPRQIWLFDTAQWDVRVGIGSTLDRKLEALRQHDSQKHSGGGMIEAARAVARAVGGEAEPAESFRALRLTGRP